MTATRTAARTLLLALAAGLGSTAHAQCELNLAGPTNYQGLDQPVGVEAADLNGDSYPDIVAVDRTGSMMVLLGNGDGTMTPGESGPVSTVLLWVDLADLNGDGAIDVVATTGTSGRQDILVLLGNGDGTFGAPSSHLAGEAPYGLDIADIDADGWLDVAVSTGLSKTLTILYGNGGGGFEIPVDYASFSYAPYPALADLDDDGLIDILIAGSVLWGEGGRQFSAPQELLLARTRGKVADVNLDGRLDVITWDHDIMIHLGEGSRAFGFPLATALAGADLTELEIEDFDADGLPDIAAADFASPGRLALLSGNGDGTFNTGPIYPYASAIGLAPADFDGDGRTDLASTQFVANGAVGIWHNTGGSHNPPNIHEQPAGQVVTAGDPAVLSVVAVTGSGLPISYQWYRDGVALVDGGRVSGAATAALTIDPVQPGDAAVYGVVVSIPACDGGTVDAPSAPAVLGVRGPACPGDFNTDGTVNTLDVIAFLNAWAAGCP